MILDKQTILSDDQVITASTVSTNVYDFGAIETNPGQGKAQSPNIRSAARLHCQVTADFATCDGLTVLIYTDDDVAFGSPTLIASRSILVAALLTGTVFFDQELGRGMERYLRLTYTIAGINATTGKIHASLTLDNPVNL